MNKEFAPSAAVELKKGRHIGVWLVLAAVLILAAYVALALLHRRTNQADLASWTRERAVPYVAVVQPHQDANPEVLALPGNIAAWYEASIHSQVAGYVKSWSRDIGARVKKGEVLAEIDTPELDERLAQAREELARAQAALSLAQVTAERWTALRSSSAVSKQSADEKTSDQKVKEADVGAASANLDRLKAQKLFAQIVAPFDGVVTARNIDIGSYVAPDRGFRALFKVADIHAVRIYVNVPQIYSSRLAEGMKATLTTPQWPDRPFAATIATTSNAIAAQTGSLLVELDRPNEDGALYPGSYADVISSCRSTRPSSNSASALSIGEKGSRVATVDADKAIRVDGYCTCYSFPSELTSIKLFICSLFKEQP